MTTPKVSLKDLEALLKLLNRHGVTSYSAEGLSLSLEPTAVFRRTRAPKGTSQGIETNAMPDEEVALWSAPRLDGE